MQIYVNLLWSYAEYQLEGTTDRNTADPLAGHLKLLLTKMHACVYVCACPGCDDGDPDDGPDADDCDVVGDCGDDGDGHVAGAAGEDGGARWEHFDQS